ncbi:hypothetical protein G7085_07700 [Tessaracoccus sp. HDW20]|uniref:hypothetical protein n=1 Tax=Tessaracoccus coleopterorum TaxID=2714950 RepID=UPI0018D2CCBD|nr:hypothetical protein [Tessaracoccus coleopterorum]NHB84528.1 hypothetical protein [Tessaracoccus coleopterorum]
MGNMGWVSVTEEASLDRRSDRPQAGRDEPERQETRLTEAELEALPTADPENPVDRADVLAEAGKGAAAWAGGFWSSWRPSWCWESG